MNESVGEFIAPESGQRDIAFNEMRVQRVVTATSPAVPHPLEPFQARFRVYLRWAIILTFTFVAVYGSLNWWTAQRAFRLHLYADWELAMPHLPEAVLVYVSVQTLYLLPPLALSVSRIARLGRAMLAAILIGGLMFVLLPAELGFERATPKSWLEPIYAVIYRLDRPHNLFPSLHVALGTLVLLFLARDAGFPVRLMYALWWLSLCASVLLTHQHHLLDVVGGLVLAVGCYAGLRDRRQPAAELSGA